jgi:hypothetical protein
MRLKEAGPSLAALLAKDKTSILHRWAGLVFDTYPADTANVLKAGGDRFANPVAYAVTSNLEMVLDGLIAGKEVEALFPCLEEILKIRAVQDFTPDGATSFMAFLKQSIEFEVKPGRKPEGYDADRTELEGKINQLCNACANIYGECRRRINSIKSDEKRRTALNMARLMGTAEGGL